MSAVPSRPPTAPSRAGTAGRTPTARAAARPPLEHRLLMTATLCLLAFGAVMVYSASSPSDLLGRHGGNGSATFLRYVVFCLIGLVGMRFVARHGLRILLAPRTVRLMLTGSFGLLLLVLVPGFGVQILGARRWFAAGPIQFQPSELMKLALIVYSARFLADHPRLRSFKTSLMPILLVVGPACLLIVIEPDLGTTLVVAGSIGALLIAAGMPVRWLGALAGGVVLLGLLMVIAKPYQQARLTAFLHPWSSAGGAGYQAVQGQIALGSGGLVGVGLGRSVQKVFYLPEAQTDFILAVIGEELGVMGIAGVIVLYAMIAYAGLRTARRAAGRYAKLLATGLTSLILCQGILNIFVVLGLAPLTGVPLPFISYAPTNLWVMLGAIGLLLGIASPQQARLRLVDESRHDGRPSAGANSPGGRTSRRDGRDRSRRDRRPRRAGDRGRRRAAG